MPGLFDISEHLYNLVDNLQSLWSFMVAENVYDTIRLFLNGLADGNIIEIVLGAAITVLLTMLEALFTFFGISITSLSFIDLLLGSVFSLFIVYQFVKWLLPT